MLGTTKIGSQSPIICYIESGEKSLITLSHLCFLSSSYCSFESTVNANCISTSSSALAFIVAEDLSLLPALVSKKSGKDVIYRVEALLRFLDTLDSLISRFSLRRAFIFCGCT